MTASFNSIWWNNARDEVDPSTLDRIWIGTISRCGRGYLGISQAELAEGIGIGRTTILSIEKGINTPDYETAARLREFFEKRGISVDVEGDILTVSYSVNWSTNNSELPAQAFARWRHAKETKNRALRSLRR